MIKFENKEMYTERKIWKYINKNIYKNKKMMNEGIKRETERKLKSKTMVKILRKMLLKKLSLHLHENYGKYRKHDGTIGWSKFFLNFEIQYKKHPFSLLTIGQVTLYSFSEVVQRNIVYTRVIR